MEFVEGSRGIYRPIRVLFDTPIYDRALQLCWNIKSYKSQVALMMALLSLQQENQIPSWVTAEDMIQLILERSKSTLRERLWEFELEGFDEDEARPLLTLLWAVNVSNKTRDVEFEARTLLKSPEAAPPNFQHRIILNKAQDYAKILWDLEAPGSKLLCPEEVVIEVVPRVLQGFWVLPPRALLNMPSQLLSKLSVGVAKATLDRVCDALTTVGCRAHFSRSIRDDMVLSVLTEIRQTWPLDTLVNSIKSFSPVLLTEIADVAMRHICEMFRPRSPEEPALLTPEAETPASISEEQHVGNPEMDSAVVEGPLSCPAEPAASIQTGEDGSAESSLDLDPKPSSEPDTAALTSLLPPPDEPAVKDQAREDGSEDASLELENSTELDIAAVVTPLLSPPAEDQAREDGSGRPSLEIDPSTELDTLAVVTPLLLPPAEPAAEVPDGEDGSRGPSLEMDNPTELDTAAVVTPLLSQPVEPAAEDQAREDGSGGPGLQTDPSSEIDTFDVVTPLLSQPVEPAAEDQTRKDGSGGPSLELDPSTGPDTAVVTPLLPQPVEPTVEVDAIEDGSRDPSPETKPKVTTTPDSVVATPPAKPASKVQVTEELTEERCREKEPEPSSEPNTRVPLEPVATVTEHSAVNTSVRERVRRFLNRLRPLFCCFPQQNQTD